MNHLLCQMTRAVVETFDLPEPILEIGSYQVAGQEEMCNLRRLFPGKTYTGLDVRGGPGVDVVGDVEQLPFADGSVGTVIAMSAFEHVRHFWRGFAEVKRVLRPAGAFLVSCPFSLRIHNYPSDYWRFTPEALDVLLEDYPSRLLGWHGPAKSPENVWALAFGAGRPAITPTQFEKYRTLLREYAYEPTRWTRRLRYRLASLWCGRRPFAAYLDRNEWESVVRTAPAAQTQTAGAGNKSGRADLNADQHSLAHF